MLKKTSSDDCGANTSLESFQRLLLRQAGTSKRFPALKLQHITEKALSSCKRSCEISLDTQVYAQKDDFLPQNLGLSYSDVSTQANFGSVTVLMY